MAYNSWIRFLFWIMKISKYKNRFIKVCAWSSAGRPGYTKIKLLLLSILKGPHHSIATLELLVHIPPLYGSS